MSEEPASAVHKIYAIQAKNRELAADAAENRAALMNARGISDARGRQVYATQVIRVRKRLADE